MPEAVKMFTYRLKVSALTSRAAIRLYHFQPQLAL